MAELGSGSKQGESPPRREAPARSNELVPLVREVMAEFKKLLEAVETKQAPTLGPVLPEGQQRMALCYRVIRNDLGNYGGHGDGFDRARLAMTHEGDTLKISDFPKLAKVARVYATDSSHKVLVKEFATKGEVTLDEGISVQFVELLDGAGVLVAAGLPARRTFSQP